MNFRTHHLLQLLTTFGNQHLPLDVFLRIYFKENHSIGSHDRKYLAETIYSMVRYLNLIDVYCPNKKWEERIEIFNNLDLTKAFDDETIALHIRLGFPYDYFELLKLSLGRERAISFCKASNLPAPITLRVNPIKTTQTDLLKNLEPQVTCKRGEFSPLAIITSHRLNFFGMDLFKNGHFEMQDEGSQLVAFQIEAKPREQVLDYCAGAGGKTLAFAPQMNGKGQIYLHDIRPNALLEAKKRLKRAGIENAQILSPDRKHLFHGKMDWVLVDVPCSGSGTLRRNPDMKWRFTKEGLLELISIQRSIVQEAILFLKPKGKLVYATCSVFDMENEQQTLFFQENFGLSMIKDPFISIPSEGNMDGFYAATFTKTGQQVC